MVASVVKSMVAELMAFSSATLMTLMGSMIPASIMSQYSPVLALKPCPMGIAFWMASDLYHALVQIFQNGYSIACFRISLAMVLYGSLGESSMKWVLMSAMPPPSTIHSSIADLVAFRASSILNFFCCISMCVDAPTLMIPIPHASLLMRSWYLASCHVSVIHSIDFLMTSTLAVIASSLSGH